MSEPEEFILLAKNFEAVITGQAFFKDEVIQAATERMMLFVAENLNLIARALRRDGVIQGLPESGERILDAEQIKVLIAFREAVK